MALITLYTEEQLEVIFTRVLDKKFQNLNLNPPAQEPEIYLTRKEAAAVLQVSQRTISTWVKEGKIHGLRLPSGLLRFKKSSISLALKNIKTIKYGREK
jgi:excisionase family DNA binding protein